MLTTDPTSRLATKPEHMPRAYSHPPGVRGRRYLVNPYAASLIREYRGRIYGFDCLSASSRLSLAYYMGIDGEAWNLEMLGADDGLRRLPQVADYALSDIGGWHKKTLEVTAYNRTRQLTNLARILPAITTKFASERFGYVEVPTEEVCHAVWHLHRRMAKHEKRKMDYLDFTDYHRWFMQFNPDWVKKTPTWPSIFNSFSDAECNLFEDGWHRFHGYVEHKIERMPIVWFPSFPEKK